MTRAPVSVRVSAAGLVLLALTFGLGSFALGFRHEGVPGPGLLPLLTSALLLPVGVRLLLRPALLPGAAPVRATPLLALALLAVYGAALPWGGFVAPSVAFLAVWVVAFHRRPLAHAIVLALCLSAGAAGLFRLLLGVPMPLWPWRG